MLSRELILNSEIVNFRAFWRLKTPSVPKYLKGTPLHISNSFAFSQPKTNLTSFITILIIKACIFFTNIPERLQTTRCHLQEQWVRCRHPNTLRQTQNTERWLEPKGTDYININNFAAFIIHFHVQKCILSILLHITGPHNFTRVPMWGRGHALGVGQIDFGGGSKPPLAGYGPVIMLKSTVLKSAGKNGDFPKQFNAEHLPGNGFDSNQYLLIFQQLLFSGFLYIRREA